MKPVITVEHVSKKFSRRADVHKRYGVKALVYELIGRSQDTNLRQDEFLAVDDISFTLYPGDTLALIGRNGCGKTTTLKMLNGTLKPDAGRIIIDGRLQALIALGAGFNPRLSGRENIFNASAVLGLTPKKTKSIIDEVVDFAELDEFIDSPVQTYSSGMYARLGFSVSVHLEPDILLVDEILSVGDFAFQHKSFGKMQKLKKAGCAIIVVSHAHSRVVQLCDQGLWLHRGKMLSYGGSKQVVNDYLSFLDEQMALKAQEKKSLASEMTSHQKSPEKVGKQDRLKSTIYGSFLDDSREHLDQVEMTFFVHDQEVNAFNIHDKLDIEYGFNLRRYVENLNINLAIYRKEDGFHFGKISTLDEDIVKHIHDGRVRCRVTIPDFNLNPGEYVLVLAVFEGYSFIYRNVVKEFVVKGNGKLTYGVMDFNATYKVVNDNSQPAEQS